MATQIEGLGEVSFAAPERVPLRMRESGATLSGWSIAVETARGHGAIVVAEGPGETHYRGDGVFLGWPQERLEGAYRALLPPPGPDLDIPQLG